MMFDDIVRDFIQKASVRTKEAAGSLKVNTDDWQRIIVSNVLGGHSLQLRKS